MSGGLIAVLLLGAGLLAAVLLGVGKRSGQGGGGRRGRADALTRACHGNRAQAERLEALEQRRAGGKLSRRAARQRALERMTRDRG